MCDLNNPICKDLDFILRSYNVLAQQKELLNTLVYNCQIFFL